MFQKLGNFFICPTKDYSSLGMFYQLPMLHDRIHLQQEVILNTLSWIRNYTGVECVSLSPPENGSIIIGPRTVGSLAVYSCDVGYSLSIAQPAYRRCQVNGSWSGYEPTCDRK